MTGIKTPSLRPPRLDFGSIPVIHWTAMLHSVLWSGSDRVWPVLIARVLVALVLVALVLVARVLVALVLVAPMTFLIDLSGIGWLYYGMIINWRIEPNCQ
jgi:hypothetical protein